MSTDRIIIRHPQPHEVRAVADVARAALLNGPSNDEEWERWGSGWVDNYRGISAWDDDRCVGNSGAFHFDTLVPGGAWVPTAGVTRVGVLPTHSRRGVLTRMMHQLLTEEREEGKVLASLRASEAPIYGRFGFGLAGEAMGVLVHPSRVRPIVGAAKGSCRLLHRDELKEVVPAIYGRITHRVGAVTRDSWMWRRVLADAIDGKKAEFVVAHSSPDGVDDGYAVYSIAWDDGEFIEAGGHCELHEMFATSGEVELALWEFLTTIGLVRSIRCEQRPVDDVLRLVAHDYRGYEVKRRWDEQWLRLLDVPAALSARSYHDGPAVTIAVTDPMFPANDGTYHVSGDGAHRVAGDADLVAPIASLSAAYMGAVSWADLLSVGRLAAGTTEAAQRADTLFRHSPGTWCATFF